ncbi:MAG: lysophospholipid acyltransferase family protein [Pseudazoarcus pumilus]|nr:lysophospholipid acyltransferase family protein [Pseudazoarcus pumilus]
MTILFRLLSRLPLPWLHALGAVLGRLVWWCSPQHRANVRANLQQAFGKVSPELLAEAVAHAGRQMLEAPFVWCRPLTEVHDHVLRFEGRALFEAARQRGQSVLMLTAHLGCFEACLQAAAAVTSLTVLYRPPRKRSMHAVVGWRARGPVSVAPADVSGVRKLARALRAGEIAAILPDQAPRAGEGMWVPFFGRPAWTMTLAARLSETPNVCVLLCWAERVAGKGWVVRAREPAEPIEGDLAARCAAINREVERMVRECPAQYLWSYERYKVPRGVPQPEERS